VTAIERRKPIAPAGETQLVLSARIGHRWA
jgi:hypothetical protein